MSKTCLVCKIHHLELINIFRHPEKLDSMLMLHWGLRARKGDCICSGCCNEVLSAFDLNQSCQQSNPHNPELLKCDGTVLDPQINSVDPTKDTILTMCQKIKAEPQSEEEFENKTKIVRMNVENTKLDGYFEKTSKSFTPIKLENLGDTSGENIDDSSECYTQCFKTEIPYDNEDSDEINENQFAVEENEMCLVASVKLETNQRTFTGERPYKCLHCPKTFITSTRLKEHKRTHTGERPFACSSCSKTYITAASLHIHVRTHMKDKPFVCSECGKSCTTSQLLKYHKRTHTGERPYTCSYCPKSYITNGRLQRHMFSHMKEKNEGPFECRQCTKTFKSSWAHKVHIRMHTQEINTSDSTKSFRRSNKHKPEVQNNESDPEIGAIPPKDSKVKTERHDDESEEDFEILNVVSETQKLSKNLRKDKNAEDVPEAHSRTIELPVPSKKESSDDDIKYESTSEFNVQLKNSKNVSEGLPQKLSTRMHRKEKTFTCLECGKCFLTTTKLQIHKRTHTGERPYKCQLCTKTFVSSYKLTEHKRIHIGDKPYECRFCSKSFLRSTEVQGHERTHTKEKPYICSECGKGFVTSSVLNRHKRIHTGVKPYVCNHCSKTFTSKFYLQTHIRSHTKENLFECSECGKSFTTSKLFQDHKMTHTGERPYACSHCSKTYINRSGLINHTRGHTKEERKRKGPYECHQCSKAFRNSCAYKVHALLHTKQENSSDTKQTPHQSNIHVGTDLKHETHLVDQNEIAFVSKEIEAIDSKINESKGKPKIGESTEDRCKADVSKQNAESIIEGCRDYFKKEKSVDIEEKDKDQNEEKLYICSYCSKTFHSSRNLQIHVRTHKQEKSYFCFECGKRFISLPDFKHHKRTHTKERPYACRYCSKTYINSGHMQKHMRIHTREKHNVEKHHGWKEISPFKPQQKFLHLTTNRLEVVSGDGVVLKHEIDSVDQAEITIYSSDDGLVEDFDILSGETEKI